MFIVSNILKIFSVSEILASKLLSPQLLISSLRKYNRYLEAAKISEIYMQSQNKEELLREGIQYLNKSMSINS